MKIALPLWSLTRFRGGTERAGAELANALTVRGHKVIIFTSGLERVQTLYPLHQDIQIEYSTIELRGMHTGLTELRRQVLCIRPDVLLGMGSDATLLSHVAMVGGTRTALVLSDRSAPLATGGINWNQPDRLTAFSAADRIHCQLPRYAQSFPSCLQERIQIIPNASSFPEYTDTQAHRLRRNPKIILALGRLRDSIKQHSLLIGAFALLRQHFPDWELHIWGGDFYGEKSTLDTLIAHEKLQSCVHIKGETLSVGTSLRTASLFCHPSRYEGFPMAVVEAMRHSLPVVGFAQCQALADVLEPSFSRLASEMTPESLAKSLAPLMADENLRNTFGQQALIASRKYTMESVIEQWESLLREAVQARKHQQRIFPHFPQKALHHAQPTVLAPIKDAPPTPLPAAHHWQNFLRVFLHLLKTSQMFDYDWYRANYLHGPEIMDPMEHYLRFGADKGYNPNAWFHTAEYKKRFLSNMPSMNPLLHYYLWGKAAGCSPAPSVEHSLHAKGKNHE